MTDKLRLITGDASQVLDRLIEEKVKVDMVFASPNPPFFGKGEDDIREKEMLNNIGNEDNFPAYVNNLMKVFEKVYTVLKDDGSFWLHAGDYSIYKGSRLQVPQRLALHMIDQYDWILKSELIWFRPGEPWNVTNKTRFKKDFESVFWFTKMKNVKIYDDSFLDSSIIEARYVEPFPHMWGSGFPKKLVEIPIKTCTIPGQTVLDPYSGTGTTGAVALKMNRRYIGIELFAHKNSLTMERLRAI